MAEIIFQGTNSSKRISRSFLPFSLAQIYKSLYNKDVIKRKENPMDYCTFDEAFAELDRLCKRNYVQNHSSNFDSCFEARQVRALNKIVNKIKAISQIGNYSFAFTSYYDYRTRFEFNIQDCDNKYSKGIFLYPNNISAFFSDIIRTIMEIERYKYPSPGYGSSFDLTELINCKNSIINMEKNITQAIADIEKVKKEIAMDLFVFQKVPNRERKRTVAWEARRIKINGLENELRNLWIKEHPLKVGSDVLYRYLYKGHEHGERKPGTIASFDDNGGVAICTAKGRIINKTMGDLFRIGNSRYEESEEYRRVEAARSGKLYEPEPEAEEAAPSQEDVVEALVS